MKIISTKEYNKLKETQCAYLDLLMKPLQGVFEKVTDDDLLRENGLLYAENERLNNIINGLDNTIENLDEVIEQKDNILNKAKEKAIDLEKKYGYILGDLIYLLMQGSDKE